MSGKLIAILVAILLIAGIGITVGVTVNNQPEAVMKNTLENTVEDLLERDELSALVKMLEGGSLTLEGEYEHMAVDGKFYFSNALTPGGSKLFVEDLCVQEGDHSLNLTAFSSADYAYITDCNLLDKTYGMVRGDMEDAFLDSPFAFDSGSEYALDEASHHLMVALLRMYDGEEDTALIKDAEKMADKYAKKIEKIFAEHATFESEKDKIRVGGTRMDCRIITVTVDEMALADMVSDLYDELSEDKKLRKLFIQYGDYFSDVMNEDAAEYYDDVLMNADTWETLIESIEDMNFEISVELVTPKSSAVLRQLTVRAETDYMDEEILFIDFGKDGIKKADYITLELGGADYVLEIAENNKSTYEAYISVDKRELVRLEIDRKNEAYSLTLMEEIVITGDFIRESDTVTISVDKIREGKNSQLMDLRVTIDTKDKMPKPLDEDDIVPMFEIDQEELAELMGSESLSGTYSMMVLGTGQELVFDRFGGLTIKIYTLGQLTTELDGVYEVHGGRITINHEQAEGVLLDLTGEFALTVGEDQITIDGMVYKLVD